MSPTRHLPDPPIESLIPTNHNQPIPSVSDSRPKILYCRCAYAKVVPNDVKDEVLEKLCESGVPFESVSDLCEMSARKDPRLADLLEGDQPVKIVACFPRAVEWLFHSAGATFPKDGEAPVEVLNMREQSAGEIMDSLLESEDGD